MTTLPTCLTLAIPLSVALAPGTAVADDTIKHPGEHLAYTFEIEPHLDFAWGDWGESGLGGAGYGAGARFSFPIVRNGFIPTINNSAAISVGVDFLHFGCDDAFTGLGVSCDINSLSFPVVLQWNFYISRQWSVFGEPGIFIYHQFADVSCGNATCPVSDETGVLPALYVGGRFHINDRLSLTMRVGYPTLNIGFSFFG